MTKRNDQSAELAVVELMYARAEIAQSQIFTGPIMRALEHLERALSHLQSLASASGLEKSQPSDQIEAA